MELTFNKTAGGYIAEYVATTHFNLHIEGGGRVLLYKRTSGEHGDLIASIPSNVVDVDIAVNIPATFTIVLTERPSLVTITTAEGEVINAVIPEETPEGYEEFELADGKVLSGSDEMIYVYFND